MRGVDVAGGAGQCVRRRRGRRSALRAHCVRASVGKRPLTSGPFPGLAWDLLPPLLALMIVAGLAWLGAISFCLCLVSFRGREIGCATVFPERRIRSSAPNKDTLIKRNCSVLRRARRESGEQRKSTNGQKGRVNHPKAMANTPTQTARKPILITHAD